MPGLGVVLSLWQGWQRHAFWREGTDTLYGRAGNDTLQGDDGDDLLDGRDDWVYGWDGKDTFLFGESSGHDIIMDFSSSEDKLKFTYSGTYDDLLHRAVQRDNDVIITFDEENTLTLEYVYLSNLTPQSFIWGL